MYTCRSPIAPAAALLGFCLAACTSRQVPSALSPAQESLAGEWLVTLQEADGVELDVLMTLDAARGGRSWSLYSRPGGTRAIAGAAASLAGRVTGRLPKEALIHVGGSVATGARDTLHLDGVLQSPFLGRRVLRGHIADGRLDAELTRATSGARAGTMKGVRRESNAPLRDYRELAGQLERVIRTTIYDPAQAEQPSFRRFFQELYARFARARDDLDVVAAFQALKPSLNTSHINFIRNPRLAATPLDSLIAGAAASDPSQLVRLSFPAPGVAFLRVTRWHRVDGAIDAAFARIDSAAVPFLMLDIRGNPGGDATSVVPLTHLIRTVMPVGVFAGRRWYAEHGARPRPADFPNIRTLSSNATPAELFRNIREHGAVAGSAVPREPYYAGTVFLLTDRGTGSASEPLAHALKQSGRAVLIGERTAGAMLMALPQPVGDGWIATVPEADYVAADGTRLEGLGVAPHIAVSSNSVFLAVADQMSASAPFSAEFLRGGSYEALQKPRDAERAYHRALELARAQQPAPSPIWRGAVHRRLARLLGARGELLRAQEQWREVLRHLPDDQEAIAALRRGTPGVR